LTLAASETGTFADDVDHLACRYYRIFLGHNVSRIDVQVRLTDPADSTPLKAELAVITKSMRRLTVHRATPGNSTVSGFSGQLAIAANGLVSSEIDHLVLVISNCGTESARNNAGGPHDDAKKYETYISAS